MSCRFALACHILAFAAGFLIDLWIGDPLWLPHPVALIGRLITGLENLFLGKGKRKETGRESTLLRQGRFSVCVVCMSTLLVAGGILTGAYLLHPLAGILAETVMTWQALAVKDLRVESMRVYDCLTESERKRRVRGNKTAKIRRSAGYGLEAARNAVSMIVGRDTAQLDEAGVIRAAVETVAENTSDGVVAPMLYLALGGPVLGFWYKAVNTMDSMIGYKNDRYLYFGRAAAKLDDAVNFLPARISAGMMLAVCAASREFDARQAGRIYRRDRRKHASPNSAHTEAVCAGALGVRLAGPASYFGRKVKKPYIGDAIREIEAKDIVRANRLMMRTAWLCEAVCLGIMGGVLWMI